MAGTDSPTQSQVSLADGHGSLVLMVLLVLVVGERRSPQGVWSL